MRLFVVYTLDPDDQRRYVSVDILAEWKNVSSDVATSTYIVFHDSQASWMHLSILAHPGLIYAPTVAELLPKFSDGKCSFGTAIHGGMQS